MKHVAVTPDKFEIQLDGQKITVARSGDPRETIRRLTHDHMPQEAIELFDKFDAAGLTPRAVTLYDDDN